MRERDHTMWRCCAAALLLCAALARAQRDTRSEAGPVPFVMGSRYGRSPPPSGRGAPAAPPLRHMSPRNDRFFMGVRYGKRAGPAPAAPAPAGWEPPAPPMLCRYTGLFPLYRCAPRSRLASGLRIRRADRDENLTSSAED